MRLFLLSALFLCLGLWNSFCAGATLTAGEKREMPLQYATSSFGGYRTADSMQSNNYLAAERQSLPPGINVAFGPAAPSSGNYGTPQAAGPPYPPYAYKDPGFSVQTGFEGFLVPNPWYSVIPWGIEGIVLVGIAIVFILAIKAGIIFLLFKIFRFGKLFKDDDGGETSARSYAPSIFNQENLSRITTHVFDAIDKYNELIKAKSD